jgi:hypothetical protein
MFNETNHVLDTCICICTIHTHIYDKSRTTFGVQLVPISQPYFLINHISLTITDKKIGLLKKRDEKY